MSEIRDFLINAAHASEQLSKLQRQAILPSVSVETTLAVEQLKDQRSANQRQTEILNCISAASERAANSNEALTKFITENNRSRELADAERTKIEDLRFQQNINLSRKSLKWNVGAVLVGVLACVACVFAAGISYSDHRRSISDSLQKQNDLSQHDQMLTLKLKDELFLNLKRLKDDRAVLKSELNVLRKNIFPVNPIYPLQIEITEEIRLNPPDRIAAHGGVILNLRLLAMNISFLALPTA